MRVIPIASTIIRPEGWDLFAELGFNPFTQDERGYYNDEEVTDPDILAEFAGRNCYQSFNRPNPKTASNKGYLKNTVDDLAHESILEHSSVTFFVDGVSRNLLLELERHRHISFSVISTRYVAPVEMGIVLHPNTPESVKTKIYKHDLEGRYLANQIFNVCKEEEGLDTKQSREVARQVLGGNTETKMVVTGNLRAWRYIVNLRWHPKADKEIHDFAEEILRQLKIVAPNSVQSFPDLEELDT